MVIGEGTPVWSNLGQTASHPRRLPGARYSYCPADAFEEACQDPDNPYGGPASELFGLGQGVLFPDIERPDYAVNPLSAIGVPGFERVPGERMMYDNSSEMFGLGQQRIPDTESLGTVRIPDAEELRGLGQIAAYSTEIWPLLISAGLITGSFFTKGAVQDILRGVGIVMGGISATSMVAKISK